MKLKRKINRICRALLFPGKFGSDIFKNKNVNLENNNALVTNKGFSWRAVYKFGYIITNF